MADSSNSRVYVLGAGCSCDDQHGYPLAEQFVLELDAYVARIAGAAESQRIRKAAQDTCTLFKQCRSGACHATTIDELIDLIWTGRCDDQLSALNSHSPAYPVTLETHQLRKTKLRTDAVRKAKIATTACFLEGEPLALHHQVTKYRDFIQHHLLRETGVGSPCRTKLEKSSARVLTFNYDRLFERSFVETLADPSLKHLSPYQAEYLNSGLSPFGEIAEIAKDRFCFLKLHGSVGRYRTIRTSQIGKMRKSPTPVFSPIRGRPTLRRTR